MRHRHRHLPRGVAARRPPYFSSSPPLPQEMAPHTAGPHQKAKNCDTFSPFGEGGSVEGGERDSAAPQHGAISRKSLLRLVRRRGKGGERKYKASACARIVRDTEESAAAMAAFPLACVRHTRPSEEWHRSSHRGGRLRRGGHLSARPPSDGEEGGGGGGVSETCGLLLLQASLH